MAGVNAAQVEGWKGLEKRDARLRSFSIEQDSLALCLLGIQVLTIFNLYSMVLMNNGYSVINQMQAFFTRVLLPQLNSSETNTTTTGERQCTRTFNIHVD